MIIYLFGRRLVGQKILSGETFLGGYACVLSGQDIKRSNFGLTGNSFHPNFSFKF